MNFIDFFSGAGMFRKGMEDAGHKCVGFVEIDKKARETYTQNYDTNEEWTREDVMTLQSNELPEADIWCAGFPCFEENVLILTNSGYKRIIDVNVGDKVLTHTNTFKEVILKMQNFSKNIYELDIFGTEFFKATENHPFYVKSNSGVKWIETKDLSKEHYIGVGINNNSIIPFYKNSNKASNLNQIFEDVNFWWIIGRYIRSGWLVLNETSNPSKLDYKVVFSCFKDETNKLIKNIEKLFPSTPIYKQTFDEIQIINEGLTSFLIQFGKEINERILNNTIMNLPIELLKAFLEGYFSIDNSIFEEKNISNVVNRELAYGLQACIHKAYNTPCYLNKVEIEQNIEHKIQYFIEYEKQINKENAYYENGYLWFRFNGKRMLNHNNYVYNLEVEEDNSYTVFNLLTHNCKNISTANVTTRFGLSGEKSGLVWKITSLLEEVDVKPKHIFIENVRGLITINKGKDFLDLLAVLTNIGYELRYEISTAISYNIPQNRIRVYITGTYNPEMENKVGNKIEHKNNLTPNGYSLFELIHFMKENSDVKIKWGAKGFIKNSICHIESEKMEKPNIELTLRDFLDSEIDERFYLNEEQLEKIRHYKSAKQRVLADGRIWKEGAVPFPDDIDKPARCITPSDGSINRSTHVIKMPDGRYRRLTLKERARLQGLPEEFEITVSDSAASLQIGNGVVVKVIKDIAEREFKKED